jgi:hypothetical protein
MLAAMCGTVLLQAGVDPAERLRANNIAYDAAKAATDAIAFCLARK